MPLSRTVGVEFNIRRSGTVRGDSHGRHGPSLCGHSDATVLLNRLRSCDCMQSGQPNCSDGLCYPYPSSRSLLQGVCSFMKHDSGKRSRQDAALLEHFQSRFDIERERRGVTSFRRLTCSFCRCRDIGTEQRACKEHQAFSRSRPWLYAGIFDVSSCVFVSIRRFAVSPSCLHLLFQRRHENSHHAESCKTSPMSSSARPSSLVASFGHIMCRTSSKTSLNLRNGKSTMVNVAVSPTQRCSYSAHMF